MSHTCDFYLFKGFSNGQNDLEHAAAFLLFFQTADQIHLRHSFYSKNLRKPYGVGDFVLELVAKARPLSLSQRAFNKGHYH